MGVKLVASSNGSVELVPANTASNFTVTVPAKTGTMAMDGPAFSAYQSTQQTMSSSTNTKIQFQTEEFDTASCFDSATNYRFTPTVAGYYQVVISFQVNTNCGIDLMLYKNGSLFKDATKVGASLYGNSASFLIYLNGSSDYIEAYAWCSTGTTVQNNSTATYFQASMVRGA